MVELLEDDPLSVLPLDKGGVRVEAVRIERLTSLAPFQAQEIAVSAALKQATGIGLPEPGRSEVQGTVEVFWTGRSQWFLSGTEAPVLNAAVADQSDAWVCVRLQGPSVGDMMARLTPLDFDAMLVGDAARSTVFHMHAIILKKSDSVELYVFRSFSKTLIEELEQVMGHLDARQNLAARS